MEATLVADDFKVPEDTLVRYTVFDADGDELSNDNLFTDKSGRIEFRTSYDAEYIEFDVEGSDGFQPVFYQPFIYLYNMTVLGGRWPSPLEIDIPVKTKKNLIVAVRDKESGKILLDDVFVKVPDDAPIPNSPYDTSLMMDRHLSFVDKRVSFYIIKKFSCFLPKN